MSRLRQLAAAFDGDNDDRTKAVSFAFPRSLLAQVDEISSSTKLSRSAVVQTLVRDGLFDYYMDPYNRLASEAQDCLENEVDGPLPLPPSWYQEIDSEGNQQSAEPAEVFDIINSAREFFSRKVAHS